MGQLGEVLEAKRTLERLFSCVDPQVDLQVGQLAEYFITSFTTVFDLSVLLVQGEGECPIALALGLVVDGCDGSVHLGFSRNVLHFRYFACSRFSWLSPTASSFGCRDPWRLLL